MKKLTTLSILLIISLMAGLLAGCGEPDDVEAAQNTDNGELNPTSSRGDSPMQPQATGGGGGGRRSRSGPAILAREDVQGELALSEDQIEHVSELLSGDGEESQVEEHLDDLLDEDQLARYNQINLQRQGYNALSVPTVAEELGLSEEQITAIESAQANRTEGRPTREEFVKLREEMIEKIDAILTLEQIAKWNEMRGEDFEFTRQQRTSSGGDTEVK